MSAIDVTERARGVALLLQKQGSVATLGGVFVEMAIHRSEQSGKIIRPGVVLAVKDSLQVCHKQGSRNALSCNICQHEPHLRGAHIEKVVVIASDRPCLNAGSGIVERFQRRFLLRQESVLHYPSARQRFSKLPLTHSFCSAPGQRTRVEAGCVVVAGDDASGYSQSAGLACAVTESDRFVTEVLGTSPSSFTLYRS